MAQQLETTDTEGIPIYNDSTIQPQTIRIAVLGAAGVGKSSLCNLLARCDEFEVDDGLESCTKQTKSKIFYYTINNQRYKFKVTDTEGFFSPNNIHYSRNNQIEENLNIMRRCNELTNGITAILLVIPDGRLMPSYSQTIKFMQRYFGGAVSNHIILVFNKCNNKSMNDILQRIIYKANTNKSAPNKLVLDYIHSIGNKCVATECVYGNTENYRQMLLLKIFEIYNINGMCSGNIMLQSFQRLEQNIKKQKLKTKMYKVRWVITLAVVIFLGYKYNKLKAEHMREIANSANFKKQLDEIILNYGPMISEILSKIRD